MAAEHLTSDLWKLVLQRVPQRERVSSCALVSRQLHSICVSVTTDIQVEISGEWTNAQRNRAMMAYLKHYGSNLTSLRLHSVSGDWLKELPCSNLLALDLQGDDVVEAPPPVALTLCGGVPGVLGVCTSLTSLRLAHVFASAPSLSRLSVLVGLKRLELVRLHDMPYRQITLPGCVLRATQQLTHLQVHECGVEDAHVISRLTRLCDLKLGVLSGSGRVASNCVIDLSACVLPTSLQVLELGSGVLLLPSVLTAATQLTRVCFEGVSFDGDPEVVSGVSNAVSFFAFLASLPRLDTLWLTDVRSTDMYGRTLSFEWPTALASYTALIASPVLRELKVSYCGGLPDGVFQQILAPGCCYPVLRTFIVHHFADYRARRWWDAEMLSRLATCCPGLEDLRVALYGGEHLSALTRLPALTSLVSHINCIHSRNIAFCAGRVAALTHLRALDLVLGVVSTEGATAASVLTALHPLTGLAQLTSCKLAGLLPLDVYSATSSFATSSFACSFRNKALDPRQPPDVCDQLLQRCLAARAELNSNVRQAPQEDQDELFAELYAQLQQAQLE